MTNRNESFRMLCAAEPDTVHWNGTRHARPLRASRCATSHLRRCRYRATAPRRETCCSGRHAARAADTKEEDMVVRFALMAVRSFVRKDEAQDLVEYALLVALIVLGAVAFVTQAG